MQIFNNIFATNNNAVGTDGRDFGSGGGLTVEQERTFSGTHYTSTFTELGAANETFLFQGGDDRVNAGSGNDTYDGGDGFDVVNASIAPYAVLSGFEDLTTESYQVNISLSSGSASFGGNDFTWEVNNRLTDGNGTPIGFIPFSWSNSTYGAFSHSLTSIEGAVGSDGNDSLTGGDGTVEAIEPRGGNDNVDGRSGEDWLIYASSSKADANLETGRAEETHYYRFADRDGVDTFSGIENVAGGFGADKLTGDGENNSFFGGAGDDEINGGSGGVNTVLYDVTELTDGLAQMIYPDAFRFTPPDVLEKGIVADMGAGTVKDQYGDDDTLMNIQNLVGTRVADEITGDDLANKLEGLEGEDTINGGGGDDTLMGGDGVDELTGGDGVDSFAVASNLLTSTEVVEIDIVTDFTFGEDELLFL